MTALLLHSLFSKVWFGSAADIGFLQFAPTSFHSVAAVVDELGPSQSLCLGSGAGGSRQRQRPPPIKKL